MTIALWRRSSRHRLRKCCMLAGSSAMRLWLSSTSLSIVIRPGVDHEVEDDDITINNTRNNGTFIPMSCGRDVMLFSAADSFFSLVSCATLSGTALRRLHETTWATVSMVIYRLRRAHQLLETTEVSDVTW